MVSSITADEGLSRLPPEIAAVILRFRDQMRATFGPRLRDFRLYGSAARNDMHDESDIDVLVLVDGLTGEEKWAIYGMHDATGMHSISPAVIDFDQYHLPVSRATGFYREMRKESIRL